MGEAVAPQLLLRLSARAGEGVRRQSELGEIEAEPVREWRCERRCERGVVRVAV